MRTRTCGRANDAKIVRNRDSQCNTMQCKGITLRPSKRLKMTNGQKVRENLNNKTFAFLCRLFMSFLFTKTIIQSQTMIKTTMIPCRLISDREVAIQLENRYTRGLAVLIITYFNRYRRISSLLQWSESNTKSNIHRHDCLQQQAVSTRSGLHLCFNYRQERSVLKFELSARKTCNV